MAKGWLKFETDRLEPLVVTPIDMEEVAAWHARAHELRAAGMTVRAIAAELGKSFAPVQRCLNPESRARQKARQNELEREKRRTDPEHAEKARTYIRKYQHLNGGTQRYRKGV